MSASGGDRGGTEQKGIRLMDVNEQQCGDCWGEEGIKGLNGKGEKRQ